MAQLNELHAQASSVLSELNYQDLLEEANKLEEEENVEYRRNFIQRNAKDVRFLDI